jgi:hypothetical protein
MEEFMHQGSTVTSEVYCETLQALRMVIQNKRRGVLTSGTVLLHEHARQHTVARTWALLEHFNWELFDHPPYSPDLAPSDSHLSTYMKNGLILQRFNNNEELMDGVKTWLYSQAADFIHTGIQKLFPDTSASISAVTMLRSSLSMYVISCI